ncbi:MAG: LysM peptidoglycan-binding domain-containing protein [Bacteroidales bacterium]|nr:LysM peptidoglycan-binding domain-containing protein [Bacteroidales bacterium]
MNRIITAFFALLLLIGGSSCTHRLTDFTIISTRNVPLGAHAATIQKADVRVKGKDTAHMILFLPLGTPNMKEAIDKAMDKYPGAIGLADGVVKSKFWSCFFYGQSSYIVEGTPLYEGDIDHNSLQNHGQNQPMQQNTYQTPAQLPASNQYSPQQSQSDNFTMLFFHEVKKGDTLGSVADTYGVSVKDIILWNQLSSQELVPGSKLRILVR